MESFVTMLKDHPIPVVLSFLAVLITIGTPIGKMVGLIPPIRLSPRRQHKMHCRLCNGTGKDHVGGVIIPGVCEVCHGKGYVLTDRRNQPNCPHCKGTGQDRVADIHIGGTCEVCGGLGVLPHD